MYLCVCVCVCVCLCVFIILEFRNQYYKVIRALSVFMLLNNSGTAGPIWLNGMALGQKNKDLGSGFSKNPVKTDFGGKL